MKLRRADFASVQVNYNRMLDEKTGKHKAQQVPGAGVYSADMCIESRLEMVVCLRSVCTEEEMYMFRDK